jgi:hypothetical protein
MSEMGLRPKIGAVAEISIDYRQNRNSYSVSLGADGVIMAAHTTPSGNGEELTPQQTYPGVKVGAGQKNSWRFMLKDNLGTVYGNGCLTAEVRWRITTAICSALLKFGGGAEFPEVLEPCRNQLVPFLSSENSFRCS